MMPVAYRFAESCDTDRLTEMRLAYLNEDRGEMPDEQLREITISLKNYFSRNMGHMFMAVLAECGGRTIGTVYLAISEKPANPAFITGRIGTIMNVYTVPEYRRQGIASEMMRIIIDAAREKHISRLELSATGKGKGLYENLGFSVRKSAYTDMILKL